MKRQIDGEDINGKDEELFAWFNEEMNQPPCIPLVTLYTILSVFCGFVAWHIPVGSIYFGILSAICLFIAVVYFSIGWELRKIRRQVEATE